MEEMRDYFEIFVSILYNHLSWLGAKLSDWKWEEHYFYFMKVLYILQLNLIKFKSTFHDFKINL